MLEVKNKTVVNVFEGIRGSFEYQLKLQEFTILKNNNKIQLSKDDSTLHFKNNFKYEVAPSAGFIKTLHTTFFDTPYKNKKESQLLIAKIVENIDTFFNQEKYKEIFNQYIKDSNSLLDKIDESEDFNEKEKLNIKIENTDKSLLNAIKHDLNRIFV